MSVFLQNVVKPTATAQFKMDRVDLIDKQQAKKFNTYRNWGYFGAFAEKHFNPDKTNTGDPENPDYMDYTSNISTKSIFNSVAAVGHNQAIQVRANAPLLDTPQQRLDNKRYDDCSIASLVKASEEGKLGRQIYSYADFMYCKHLGKVPNNYMVTLRRFPFPAGDHINFTFPEDGPEINSMNHYPDIGRMVTWIGTPGNEMTNILKYSVKMPYKEMKSEIYQGGDTGGDNGGPLGTFLNATTNANYQSQMIKGYAGSSTFSYLSKVKGPIGWAASQGGNPPYTSLSGYRDQNKHYGPIDVIAATHIRDTGLEFNHEITLQFDYELRSYDGVNAKAAFLDLLANILATTYTTGSFWGGAYAFSGASQSNIFTNLPIYKLGVGSSMTDVYNAGLESGKMIMNKLGWNSGADIMSNLKSVLSTLGKGLMSSMLGAGLNALGRPQKQGLQSLLSPAPVGLWHLTIGNPWHPIMMIGNLIIDNTEIEHYGPLGLDDFPTGIRVNIKLKHAKPRDAALIEQMYMMGESRIYTPVGKDVMEMYNNASAVKSDDNNTNKSVQNYVNARINAERQGMQDKLASAQTKEEQMRAFKDLVESDMHEASGEAQTAYELEYLAGKYESMRQLLFANFGLDDSKMIVEGAMEAAHGGTKKGEKGFNGEQNSGKQS